MGHAAKSPFAPRGKWPVLLLRFLVMEHIMFLGVKSEGTQAQTTTGGNIPAATAGLLCISECYTCPEICSPPPSPSQPKPPVLSPPVIMYSSPPPPPQTYVYKSPPPPLQRSPPSPATPSQPPYIIWGSNPPPPPPPGNANVPTVYAPPSGGNRNSTFPYYYFYASEANSVSPLSSLAGMVVLSFSIVMVFWQEGK